MRLQKFLADAGVASRRASEKFVTEGRVSVNGAVVAELGSRIDPSHDRVTVDGVPVRERRKIYLALHKPPGWLCSRADPHKRRCVESLLPKEWANLYTVGRLDFSSEGLIFLTNDGQFALHITHPRYGIRKKYLATVAGRVEPAALGRLTQGLVHDGERLKAGRARILRTNNSHTLVEIELSEGKNREVRRMFEALGLTVERLQRIQIGPIKLGELPSGKWRTLSPVEVKSLLAIEAPPA